MQPLDFENLLRRAREGDIAAARSVLDEVYDQLRRIAQNYMKAERRGHTLQATALVNEAYLRLLSGRNLDPSDRTQFVAAAAEAMRRVLVDHARARSRVKRGGDGEGRAAGRVSLDTADVLVAEDDPEHILRLEEAFSRLEAEDPDSAQIVRLRFFAGLSGDETAAALGVSPSSVDREWAFARARLYRIIQEVGDI